MIVGMSHDNHPEQVSRDQIVNLCINWFNDYKKYQELRYLYKQQKSIIKSPLDYLDNRKGLFTMFVYCHYSGVKIDWKEIKNELKNKIQKGD
jgi:hypothetical protein